MRLTLRTMLAYLDDILEPDDAQTLGKKIEESEFASGLVHRIRSATRRLRLEAPRADGKGMGHDPNTVSEYLDNTLPQERVPEFEKVCLESDVHLAEVASCHQILTLVLGEPAEVDAEVRQRIYRLGQPGGQQPREATQSDDEAPAEETPKPAASAAASGEKKTKTAAPAASAANEKRAVPDYLRTGAGVRMAPLAITLAVAFTLAATALIAMGGLNRDGFLWRMLGQSSSSPVAQSNLSPTAPESAGPGSAGPESAGPGSADPENSRSDSTSAPTETASAGDTSTTTAPPDEVEKPAPATNDSDGEASAKPAKQPGPEKSTPADAANDPAPAASSAEPTDDKATDAAASADPPAPVDAAPAPVEAKPIGRFISEREVLARFDAKAKTWMRLPPRAVLGPGDILLAPPAYRPSIMLSTAIQIMADGPTSLQLQPADADGVMRVAFEFGRASIVTVGMAGTQLELIFAGRRGRVTFGDADTAMAVQITRFLPPGEDPEATPAKTAVEIIASSGNITWQEGAAAPTEIKAGQACRFVDELPAQVVDIAAMPKWIQSSASKNIEEIAALDLETFLAADRELSLTLTEKLEYRKHEVRSLAAQTLAYMGAYEPVLQQFSDKQQHSFWQAGLHSLRECLARDPATAAQVRIALEKRNSDEAAELYRLLWGYSQEQLDGGAAEELVKMLDHEQLAFRVLAFENLRQITQAHFGYSAFHTPARRKQSIRTWRERLTDGVIRYKNPPTPFASPVGSGMP